MRLDIPEIAEELNVRAKDFKIGELQELRKQIHQLKRLPSTRIFTSQTTFDEWAFHLGGRSELQFNIGLEKVAGKHTIRFGVAFSLKPSQSLPSIDVLLPKIALFNDYISSNYEDFADMRTWYYDGPRSTDSAPAPISSEILRNGIFIFLGIRQPANTLDFDAALAAMDRLLPLYLYTESATQAQHRATPKPWTFVFKPGCAPKASFANASLTQRKLDIQLRHNDIQEALCRKLVSKYGDTHVGAEQSSGLGVSVDVIVRRPDGYTFYEIKTAHTARGCIRQAIGQLLEYAFWPGCQEANKLVVVGEPTLDNEAKKYLRTLRSRFSLPISYESIAI